MPINRRREIETVGAGTNTVDLAGVFPSNKPEIFINGALIYPSQITSVTPNSPSAGQSRVVFTFTVASTDAVFARG